MARWPLLPILDRSSSTHSTISPRGNPCGRIAAAKEGWVSFRAVSALRKLWIACLCLVLALGNGPRLPAHACDALGAGSTAQTAPDGSPACCQPTACCCGTPVARCTKGACGSQPTPSPAPAPAPKPIELGLGWPPQPRPCQETPLLVVCGYEVRTQDSAPRNFRLLQRRMLQEALSIWRC
jgi:hypothetical protein